MTKRAFNKIAEGLRDVLAGRIARATVYRNGKPVQRYTPCGGCGNLTLTILGRCEVCRDRKIDALGESAARKEWVDE